MINLLMRAYTLKVVSEQIWNNVLASDFVSVLFIRPLSNNIHADRVMMSRRREILVGEVRVKRAWRGYSPT
jgi:hypothetical protein